MKNSYYRQEYSRPEIATQNPFREGNGTEQDVGSDFKRQHSAVQMKEGVPDAAGLLFWSSIGQTGS